MKNLFLCLLLVGCGYSSLERRVVQLETTIPRLEEEFASQTSIASECLEYNPLYRREVVICAYGLSENTIQELITSGEEVSMETILVRQEQACDFSCSYENICNYGNKIACSLTQIEE